MSYKVKILYTGFVTHDVKRFIVEKPENFKFTPGQAASVSINKPGFEEEDRPFTFTSLNDDLILEFTIKAYNDHDGVTKKLHSLYPGDELIVSDPWGTINYKGKGVFIAGGVGITPFIAILRDLRKKEELFGNKLVFSNKTSDDVILEKELRDMFKKNPDNLFLTLTKEKDGKYEKRRVDKKYLQEKIDDFNQNFYICGPPPMVDNLKKILPNLGASVNDVVFEE